MMKFELIDLIALFTVIQLLFLAVVILSYKKGKRLSNWLLGSFMASNALLIADFLLTRYGWISPTRWTVAYCIGGYMYFLLMPFLYLYLRSLCYMNFRLTVAQLLHALPFTVFVLFSLLINTLTPTPIHAAASTSFDQHIGAIEYWSHGIILHAQILSYLLASALVLGRYRKRLRELYSSIERIDLQWCNLLLAGFAALWIVRHHFPRPRKTEREYVGASFLFGLTVAGLNPTFLATWAGVVAIVRGAGLISSIHDAPAFAFGVAAGPVLWFWILLGIFTRHAETLRPENLRKIEKALPILLLIMAGVILAQALISVKH